MDDSVVGWGGAAVGHDSAAVAEPVHGAVGAFVGVALVAAGSAAGVVGLVAVVATGSAVAVAVVAAAPDAREDVLVVVALPPDAWTLLRLSAGVVAYGRRRQNQFLASAMPARV